MTNGSRVCMEGEPKKAYFVEDLESGESRKFAVNERVENGDGK